MSLLSHTSRCPLSENRENVFGGEEEASVLKLEQFSSIRSNFKAIHGRRWTSFNRFVNSSNFNISRKPASRLQSK